MAGTVKAVGELSPGQAARGSELLVTACWQPSLGLLLGLAIAACNAQQGSEVKGTVELQMKHARLGELSGSLGRLWLAGDGGAYQLQAGRWRKAKGLKSANYRSVVASESGVTWLKGMGRVARKGPDGWKSWRVPIGEGGRVRAFAGRAYATGAGSDGLFRYSNKKDSWEALRAPALEGRSPFALWLSPEGLLFVHTQYKASARPSQVHRFDGSKWKSDTLSTNGWVKSLHGTAKNDVWAVGYHARALAKAPLVAHWDGRTWSPHTVPTKQPLFDVWAESRSSVWLVGARGQLLHYDGKSWRAYRLGRRNLTAVHAADGMPVRVVVQGKQVQAIERQAFREPRLSDRGRDLQSPR